MTKKIYFDTEFESLEEGANLISIGLVNEDDTDSFYAEVPNNYSIEKCSDFCKESVLTVLKGGEYEMTFSELKQKLKDWLIKQGEVILISDSINDINQINKLFENKVPGNCKLYHLSFLENIKRRIKNRKKIDYKINNLNHHNALDDAKVNRIIFQR